MSAPKSTMRHGALAVYTMRGPATTVLAQSPAMGGTSVTDACAMIVGLIVANVVRPGHGLNIDPSTLDDGAVAQYAQAAHESTIVGFLTGIGFTVSLLIAELSFPDEGYTAGAKLAILLASFLAAALAAVFLRWDARKVRGRDMNADGIPDVDSAPIRDARDVSDG